MPLIGLGWLGTVGAQRSDSRRPTSRRDLPRAGLASRTALVQSRRGLPLWLVSVAALAASAGCADFGVAFDRDVISGAVTPDGGKPSNGAGQCVEGEVDAPAEAIQVAIVPLNVDTPDLEVAAGQVVTWTNTDTMRHDVTAGTPEVELPASQGGFRSGVIPPGARWSWRFCKARSVVYFCAEHRKQMYGYRLVVK